MLALPEEARHVPEQVALPALSAPQPTYRKKTQSRAALASRWTGAPAADEGAMKDWWIVQSAFTVIFVCIAGMGFCQAMMHPRLSWWVRGPVVGSLVLAAIVGAVIVWTH